MRVRIFRGGYKIVKRKIVYLFFYLVSIALFVSGIHLVAGDFDVAGLLLLGIGFFLFVGTTSYIVSEKMKSRKSRTIFFVCCLTLSFGLVLAGIGYTTYVQHYKVYAGDMPMFAELSDGIGGLCIAAIGVIAIMAIAGVSVFRIVANRVRLRPKNNKDNTETSRSKDNG